MTTYTKVLEVVGDKALYQFNSDSPTAFSTTFTKESYALSIKASTFHAMKYGLI